MFPLMFFPTGRYLNDTIFTQMGFFSGTSTQLQREAAYIIAETQVEQEIGTFLEPTIFTGTFTEFHIGEPLYAPTTHLLDVVDVKFIERQPDGRDIYISGTSKIFDKDLGSFGITISPYDISARMCRCDIGTFVADKQNVYRADVVFRAGLPTNSSTDAFLRLALCLAADIAMKVMYDYWSNAEPDNQAIKTFQAGRYLQSIETRWHLLTNFGASNKAQYIRNLLKKFMRHRAGKLGK